MGLAAAEPVDDALSTLLFVDAFVLAIVDLSGFVVLRVMFIAVLFAVVVDTVGLRDVFAGILDEFV